MDWTKEKAGNATATLVSWYRATSAVDSSDGVPTQVVEALSDDLNGHLALTRLHEFFANDNFAELKASLEFLGFGNAQSVTWWRGRFIVRSFSGLEFSLEGESETLDPFMVRLQELRDKKDWDAADRLRAALVDAGVEVQITKHGPSAKALPNFDLSKLEALK